MQNLDRFIKAQERDYPVAPDEEIFKKVLDKYYNGKLDKKTLEILSIK